MLKHYVKKKSHRIISGIMSLLITSTFIPKIPAYAEESMGIDNYFAETLNTEQIYTFENYEVTMQLQEKWENGYIAVVKISNIGEKSLENWMLKTDYCNAVTNVWNAQAIRQENGDYLFLNSGWNADIPVGGCIEFSIIGNENFEKFPDMCSLVGETVDVKEEDYTIEYKLDSDWNDSFLGTIFITNNTNTILEDWQLEFDFGRSIIDIWDAVIEKQDADKYQIRNAGYNANILPGQTISFSFKGCLGTREIEPENIILKQIKIADESEKLNFQITIEPKENMYEYKNIDGYIVGNKLDNLTGNFSIPDENIKNISVSIIAGYKTIPQNIVTWENGVWSLEDPQMLIGDNEIEVVAINQNDEIVTDNMHIWNTSYENTNLLELDKNDDDKDGLFNYQEEQYGTKPDNGDTDGDSFSDTEELFILKTDPLVYNEDDDDDNDGLSNLDELKNNTNPFYMDTDYDGLSDYDELLVYNTNPKITDTDRDGLSDFLEVKYGTNPLIAEVLDANGNMHVIYTCDKANKAIEASIDISMLPEQLNSFEMVDIKSDDAILSSDIPGYLGEGSAYDFYLDGTFTNATLSFELSNDIWNSSNFEPSIYYYNEETGMLEEMKNVIWNKNIVSVQLEHFSRYILLNKKIFNGIWKYDLLFSEETINNNGLDVAFVIDSSGSMTENDSDDVRKTVTKNFIDKLVDNDRAAIIDFDTSANTYSKFTNDKNKLKLAVDKIDSKGGTKLNCGITAALDLFNEPTYSEKNNQKCIVMLTDGKGSYDKLLSEKAVLMGVKIYVVGLGNSVSKSDLEKIGTYFHASEADKLHKIFDDIHDFTDLHRDTDKDGISDYYEKEMNSGNLRLGTGVSLIGMNYLNPDSDGDTINDGDEIEVRKVGSIVYVVMKSNPTKKDSDDDGVNDDIERDSISTNIGTHKLNPFSADTDHDGISDGDELGNYISDFGYYRVNSNPFMKEDFVLGNQEAVSYVLAEEIPIPIFTKKEFTSGTMEDGTSYTIYTFIDTSAIDVSKRKIVSTRKMVEIEKEKGKEYYLLFAVNGNSTRGGQGDEIYRKASYVDGKLVTKGSALLVGLNAKFSGDKKSFITSEDNPNNFLYYDNLKGTFLNIDGWKEKNFEKRFELNCDYDKYLPINSFEANLMGFRKLSAGETIYHMPDGIEDELQVGASHKYIRDDGLEAIYRVRYTANSVEEISSDYSATELLKLQDNPIIGPTFNYSPNDSDKLSDVSVAHYYFDMLPYFWWGAVE